MLCALTEFNPRISPVLLIYRFALWKTEETDFTSVLAVTLTTVDWAITYLICSAPYVLHENFDLFLIQAVLSAD
jgi:hypothetical protein